MSTEYGPGDAGNSIEVTPRPAAFGWGLLHQSPTGATENLSGFAGGTLNFQVRTTYPGKVEVGLSTDTQDREPQEAYLQLEPGRYGYCNTGAWCTVSIPLRDFAAKNPKIDLSLVMSRFVIADVYARTGNAPGSTARLYLDGIHWAR